jgi:hypothetical protein
MSSTLANTIESTQSQVLSAIETSQTTVLGATTAVLDLAAKFVPEQLTNLDVTPFTKGFVTPREGIDLTWGFAEQIAQSQRSFVENLLETTPWAATSEV